MSNTAPQLTGTVQTTSLGSGTTQVVDLPGGGVLASGDRSGDAVVLFITWSFAAQETSPTITCPDFTQAHSQSLADGTTRNLTEQLWIGDYTGAASTTFTLPSAGAGAVVACIIDRNGWAESVGVAIGSTGSVDHHEPGGGLDPRFVDWPAGASYQSLFFSCLFTLDWGDGTTPSACSSGYTVIGTEQAAGGVGGDGAVAGIYISSRRETTDVNFEDPGLWTWADYDVLVPNTLPITSSPRTYALRYQGTFISPIEAVGYWGILIGPA